MLPNGVPRMGIGADERPKERWKCFNNRKLKSDDCCIRCGHCCNVNKDEDNRYAVNPPPTLGGIVRIISEMFPLTFQEEECFSRCHEQVIEITTTGGVTQSI